MLRSALKISKIPICIRCKYVRIHFILIPLLYSSQEMQEGFIWRSLQFSNSLSSFSRNFFFISFILSFHSTARMSGESIQAITSTPSTKISSPVRWTKYNKLVYLNGFCRPFNSVVQWTCNVYNWTEPTPTMGISGKKDANRVWLPSVISSN